MKSENDRQQDNAPAYESVCFHICMYKFCDHKKSNQITLNSNSCDLASINNNKYNQTAHLSWQWEIRIEQLCCTPSHTSNWVKQNSILSNFVCCCSFSAVNLLSSIAINWAMSNLVYLVRTFNSHCLTITQQQQQQKI